MGVLVSINCITYNHEDYIADALQGFVMQITNFDYEIIIGEDCSTDRTREIVERYVEKYPNKIKLITSEKNVGAEENEKRVFDNSKGKYIALCEGDDYWIDPYKLQKQVDYMEKNPDCSICFHSNQIIRDQKKENSKLSRPYIGDKISPIKDVIIGGGEFMATASILFPKRLMENPAEFYIEAHVGDYPMQLFLASHGYAYYIDDCMSVYRSDVKGSWTSRLNSEGNVRENKVKVIMGDIGLLEGFNKYTNYKYSKEIKSAITKREFEVSLLKRKRKEIRDSRYKEYTKGLSIKEKLKIYARCYFPETYVLLGRLKSRM